MSAKNFTPHFTLEFVSEKMEERERQPKKQKVKTKEVEKGKEECDYKLQLSETAAAKRRFNIYFTTFWHLTHLASVSAVDRDIKASWLVLGRTSYRWRNSMDSSSFHAFDAKLASSLKFMEEKISNRSTATFDEKSFTIVQSFDKCLGIATGLTDQMNNDGADPIKVCTELVSRFSSALENFKELPLLWNHLFISHVYQLLLLAKESCRTSDEHADLTLCLSHHAKLAAQLREHFSNYTANSTNSTNLVHLASSKLFQPIVALDALVATLKEEAKCAAQQIPVAVTAIVHEYCHLDPFNLNDFEFIKVKNSLQPINF